VSSDTRFETKLWQDSYKGYGMDWPYSHKAIYHNYLRVGYSRTPLAR